MKKHADPGIDEVRAARMEISARYGHDIDRMLADHMKQQERFADRLIRLAPARKAGCPPETRLGGLRQTAPCSATASTTSASSMKTMRGS